VANKKNDRLVDGIIKAHYKYLDETNLSDRVAREMRKVDRIIFVGTCHKDEDIYNPKKIIEIGFEQTCSQPTMVAHMADKLRLRPGYKLLEVGTGCGYSTAVHALLISPGGTLISVERHLELMRRSEDNLVKWYNTLPKSKTGNSKRYQAQVNESLTGFDIELILKNEITKVLLRYGNAFNGYLRYQPYDRIVLTAGANIEYDDTPLVQQLKDGGILLYPKIDYAGIGSMCLVKKKDPLERNEYGTVCFVRLVPQ